MQISFVDARQGVAVGAGGVIISTVNAGKEWGEATDAVAQGPTLLGLPRAQHAPCAPRLHAGALCAPAQQKLGR
jgi:photosystem II stability/assembly factor-like uncharacterized protein